MADSQRNYNLAAREKQREADKIVRHLLTGNLVRWITLIALSVLDLTLFIEPITTVLYDSSQVANTVLCIACAVAPVVLAAGAAHFACKAGTGDGERIDAVLSVTIIVATIAVLAAGWRVRDAYYADDSGVSLLLNLVAVAATIAAFVVDYIHERKAVRLRAALDEALAEREVDELCDYLSRYTTASESDEARRAAEDASYLRKCRQVVDAGIEASVLARELLAQKVASSPEEREHIINTPLRVGANDIVGETRTHTAFEVYRAMGAPAQEDAARDWPVVPQNTHYFDEEVAQALSRHDNRLRAAQGRTGAPGSAPSSEPIPVQPDAAWS